MAEQNADNSEPFAHESAQGADFPPEKSQGAPSADDRVSAANREAFGLIGLRQGAGGDRTRGTRARRAGRASGARPETTVKILDRGWAAPLVVGPLDAPARPGGELAVVQAAAAAGLPAVVSAFAERSLAELASAADVPPWLRTYAFRDRDTARHLIARAEDAGVGALLLALGDRSRVRARRVAAPADLGVRGPFDDVRTLLRDRADRADVVWLRAATALPLLVAGVDDAPDARRALDAGADGIVVTALDALPEVAEAVAGRCPVLLSGGVRRGADVLAAIASGADAVFAGRPVLDGLRAGGRAGVSEALDGLVGEFADAMAFTATATVTDIGPEVIRTGPRRADRPSDRLPDRPPGRAARPLRKSELHASVSDPVLDTMTFLNEITSRYPEAISFAPGRPYDGFFDSEQIFGHLRRYLDHLAEQGSSPRQVRTAMYQYGPTAGQIREIIADSLRADENIDVPAESLVVTVGAQEAMLLVLRALISGPDDVLLVSSPCYVGITGAARLLDVAVTPVDERDDGFSCADLEAAIRSERARGRRPRAFYVVPDHSNPSGATLGPRARAELLELAGRHGILVLEDSPYRLVSPGPRHPALKSMDQGHTVVHIGSFSKTVFPGARVGFVVADQPVVDDAGRTGLLADELAKIKSMVTVNTSSLSQAAVAGALLAADGRVSELNTAAAAYYGDAMAATLRELDRRLPAKRRAALGVHWNKPTGGFFLTLRVPFRADNAALIRSAQDFGVIWTPMSYFHPGGGGPHGIRLSTSYLTPAQITEGTARLARFIEAQSGH
ncbi:aminotransferase class I/II-fold pyridoxal phosphate-dependent enzyme [Streptomyces alfalfae]|uniref:Aminotransferase class I/II-fold pyridoxal phosphate-dependent enzyme n=1 Tax=Streptomyces alfalfae TaxID=1642299 RepID=A0A7T4PM58_9ACTN|nr:aminotransferase class I/II-fold pyridoxal phosphate-dependent enzyme [Streptomyces alfalfae]QQC92843.1 aminotransferase class I/II-fold pyridoxal phosphate-dependent enzyme [Streptomyces alfalfae]